uniref:Right handed beta helix domain-containing protein n=1 Tax=uncultured Thiotrichaceae bacterium TaxID=298394 RepID=A0A6S6SLY6_9GAMM|nr:MAG: Unknown protein [uncultured Thiotrichaceae bacterium]
MGVLKSRRVACGVLLISLGSLVGCDDVADDIEELVDDLFEDKGYAEEIVWPAQVNTQCPLWSRGQVISISESMKLPANCAFEQVTIKIVAPDVDFDCNAAVFNGMNKVDRNDYRDAYNKEEAPKGHGFMIHSAENSAVRLDNIKIRNCQIINYIHAVDVDMELTADTELGLRNRSVSEDSLRAKAPANIQVLNSKLINGHGSAIYINRYITGFSLSNSAVKGSGGPGLYLEAGTRFATITDSVFEGNGYFSYDGATRQREARRSELAKREAIAVDSSTENTITNNEFKDNADGGIYLYKNCWEDAASDPTELPRTEGANSNRIEGNSFTDETTGVWIAERADRDLSGFDCGDPLVYEEDDEKYYRDYANKNSVVNNTFHNLDMGVRVMDDLSIVRDNVFTNIGGFDIDVGSGIREKIAKPVSGTTVEGNTLSKNDGIRYRAGAN